MPYRHRPCSAPGRPTGTLVRIRRRRAAHRALHRPDAVLRAWQSGDRARRCGHCQKESSHRPARPTVLGSVPCRFVESAGLLGIGRPTQAGQPPPGWHRDLEPRRSPAGAPHGSCPSDHRPGSSAPSHVRVWPDGWEGSGPIGLPVRRSIRQPMPQRTAIADARGRAQSVVECFLCPWR